jgi:hypothetical protein
MPDARIKVAIAVLAALLVSTGGAQAATSQISGSIAGFVRDGAGVPQMGATVLLFDRHDRLIQRSLTNERGVFGFPQLLPDLYSIHVTLVSFVPALKQRIAVQAGLQSLLYINMASILSSIELVYAAPGQGALMSDDWKWTLKTSMATRPVLRLAPDLAPAPDRPRPSAIFSETRGLVKVSAGDGDSFGDAGSQSDVGTAFALATSLFGRNQLKVSGNVGHSAHTGVPAASLRTSYSHDGSGAEVAVTMRQIYLPARGGMFGQDGLPALRTMSVAMTDRLDLTDDLRLEYGLSLDSVSFLDHLNYFSPFARLTYDMGRLGKLQAAYSSGAPPAELFTRAGEAEAALGQDLAALALAPRISVRDGRAKAERTQNMELGLEKKIGSRTLDFTGYREVTSDGALLLSGANDLLPTGDVLPDLASTANIFNYGDCVRYGYAASMTQEFGEHLEVSASAGRGGAIVADSELPNASAQALRSGIRTSKRYWAAVRATGTIPGAGTQISARYQWMDYHSILPEHLYLTQKNYPEPGLNIHIRQPIPSFPGMPGRLEATAELRNLMAQGYLPLSTPDGRRMLLVQSPRAVRGGLSFIF